MFHSAIQGSRSFSNCSKFGTHTLMVLGSQPLGKAGGSFNEVMLPNELIWNAWPSFDRRQFMNSLAALGFLADFGMPSENGMIGTPSGAKMDSTGAPSRALV